MADSKRILSERLGDERILLDLDKQEYLSLNATATMIWEGLCAHRSAREIAESIAEEFEGDLGQIILDVETFSSDLCARGLIGVGG